MRRSLSNGVSNEELLITPASIFSRLIRDVQHARRSIDVEFYIFELDNVGRSFAMLLARKARQGLAVRLLLDGFGSRMISSSLCRELRESGVELSISSKFANSRNHRKMCLIDGRVAHIGGANIADRYVVGNGLGVWYDVVLRIEGEEVALLSRLFEFDFMLEKGVIGDVGQSGRGRILFYWSELESGHAMQNLFRLVTQGAKRRLIITTPYLFPSHREIELLRNAVQRGVNVVVVVPERVDVWLLDSVMPHFLDMVRGVGVEVLIARGLFVHSKMALVDSRCVVVGSANLDSRSFATNRELMAVSFNRSVVESANRYLANIIQQCTALRDEDTRSIMPRFVAEILRPLL